MNFAIRMRAYQPDWLRGPATLDGQSIAMTPHLAKSYRLVGDWALLFSLAAVRRPDDALAFVHHYGLLHKGPGSAFLREEFSEWLEAAYTLSNLLDLYTLIQDASDGDAAALETLWETWAVRLRPLLNPMPTSDAELLSGASRSLATLVSEGLRNVQVQVNSEVDWAVSRNATGSPRSFTLAPEAPDLLGVAYLTLAMLVSLRLPLRVCEGCRRRFAPTHASQRYHDRTCAIQARNRRLPNRRRVPIAVGERVAPPTAVSVLPIEPSSDEPSTAVIGGASTVGDVAQKPPRKAKPVLVSLGRTRRQRG